MPSRRLYPVAIDGQRYDIDQMESSTPVAWQDVLAKAKEVSLAPICRCSGGDGIPLEIRINGASLNLKRKANTGHLHVPNCKFYKDRIEESGLQYYSSNVIRDGDHLIAVKFSDQGVEVGQENIQGVSLKGLLHLIWHEGGLNAWKPAWSRHRKETMFRINNAIARISLNEVPASELITPSWQLAKAPKVEYLLGLPELLELKGPHKGQLRFNDFDAKTIYIADRCLAELEAAGDFALGRWINGNGVVVLAKVLHNADKDYLRVTDLALLPITQKFLPLQSTEAGGLIHHLIAQQRSFSIPLRYDAPSSATLPDAILSDTQTRDTPIFLVGSDDSIRADASRFATRVFGSGDHLFARNASECLLPPKIYSTDPRSA